MTTTLLTAQFGYFDIFCLTGSTEFFRKITKEKIIIGELNNCLILALTLLLGACVVWCASVVPLWPLRGASVVPPWCPCTH